MNIDDQAELDFIASGLEEDMREAFFKGYLAGGNAFKEMFEKAMSERGENLRLFG